MNIIRIIILFFITVSFCFSGSAKCNMQRKSIKLKQSRFLNPFFKLK